MRPIQNVNVAVVGGAGFLGSHLVNHLIDDRDCDVLVLDNLCVGRREFVHEKATFHHCDITKSEAHLRNVFQEHETQFVFNYCAHPYIPDSFVRPLHVFEVNATGAMNVINASQEAGCEAVLQVSSAEIYGSATDSDDKIDEEFPARPHSSYGASKLAIDAMCQVRWKEAQTPVIALRQFNAYGPRETHSYVIPEIISQIHQELKLGKSMWPRTVKLGNNSFRDFQYAADAVKMATELLENGDFGEVYNMGSETGVQIYDLAVLIGRLMGCDITVEVDESRKRPWEIWRLRSDNTKINSVVSYRHQTSFEDGLLKTINDFRTNGDKWIWE